jgi:hypothetical protein
MKNTEDEERCKLTGLIRSQCAHCQAPPEYEMKELTSGLPMNRLIPMSENMKLGLKQEY